MLYHNNYKIATVILKKFVNRYGDSVQFDKVEIKNEYINEQIYTLFYHKLKKSPLSARCLELQ